MPSPTVIAWLLEHADTVAVAAIVAACAIRWILWSPLSVAAGACFMHMAGCDDESVRAFVNSHSRPPRKGRPGRRAELDPGKGG